MYLNELLKVLGVGLTPATIVVVGYFLYRNVVNELIETKKEVKELTKMIETAYVRRDINEERTKRLEEANEDLQRQIDGHTRWLEDVTRNHIK